MFSIKYQSPQEPLVHMILLCNAYPGFKAHLQNAMEQDGLSRANLSLLRDIEFLCENAIPVVPCFLHV